MCELASEARVSFATAATAAAAFGLFRDEALLELWASSRRDEKINPVSAEIWKVVKQKWEELDECEKIRCQTEVMASRGHCRALCALCRSDAQAIADANEPAPPPPQQLVAFSGPDSTQPKSSNLVLQPYSPVGAFDYPRSVATIIPGAVCLGRSAEEGRELPSASETAMAVHHEQRRQCSTQGDTFFGRLSDLS